MSYWPVAVRVSSWSRPGGLAVSLDVTSETRDNNNGHRLDGTARQTLMDRVVCGQASALMTGGDCAGDGVACHII